MSDVDFPTWFGVGSYGGLAVALLAAAAIAGYAQQRHRGSPLQLARAILACLFAGSLMLASVWWGQNRLDLYGPSLDAGEVTFWLCWTAVLGWGVPLGVLAGYVLLAAPQVYGTALPTPSGGRISGGAQAGADLVNPDRQLEPLGAGRAWGRLVPLDGPFAGQPMPLTRQLTLLGREGDNDVVVDDERASRHHAGLRWERGRVSLQDYGSLNGTLVNGQVARGPVPLKTGDVVQIGLRSYRLEVSASGALARGGLAPDQETAKTPGVVVPRLPEAPPLVLVGVSSPADGCTWPLDKAVVTIGRDDERDVTLPHPSVSREHAQIVRQQAGYFIADLHSRNGTRLNGEPIVAPALLAPGDVLRVGEVELRCEAAPSGLTVRTTPLVHSASAAPLPAHAGQDATVSFTADELRDSLRQPSAGVPLSAEAPRTGDSV